MHIIRLVSIGIQRGAWSSKAGGSWSSRVLSSLHCRLLLRTTGISSRPGRGGAAGDGDDGRYDPESLTMEAATLVAASMELGMEGSTATSIPWHGGRGCC
ncbi:unnamed protein product [Urochloa humidicola]